MAAIGVIGIIISFAILFYFSYKGANLAYLSLIACVVIIITNQMDLVDTITNVVMSGVATQAATLMLIYLFGAIFGALFVNSGAATSIADGLLNLFGKNKSEKNRQVIGIIIAFIIGAALTCCGIDNFSVIFTMIAIVSGIMRTTNIPRRYLPVLLIAPTAIGALLPGSLCIASLVAGQVLGVKTTSGLIPGLIAAVLVAILSVIYLQKLIQKDFSKGVGWTEGEAVAPISEDTRKPHPVVSYLPMVAVIICYNALGRDAWGAIAIGIICSRDPFFPVLEGACGIYWTRFLWLDEWLDGDLEPRSGQCRHSLRDVDLLRLGKLHSGGSRSLTFLWGSACSLPFHWRWSARYWWVHLAAPPV